MISESIEKAVNVDIRLDDATIFNEKAAKFEKERGSNTGQLKRAKSDSEPSELKESYTDERFDEEEKAAQHKEEDEEIIEV